MEKSIENSIIRMIFIRTILGMTQTQLAEMMGFSLSYVKKVESGARPLTTSYLQAFCGSLMVSADYVLFGEIKAPKNTMTDL